MADNILQYESTIWNTADLLRGCGIKESEWPSYMMPFFALAMIESRLLRSLDELKTQEGITDFADVNPDDLAGVVRDRVKATWQRSLRRGAHAGRAKTRTITCSRTMAIIWSG